MPIADKIMKTQLSKSLKLIKKLQTLNKNELHNWQVEQLRNIIIYAYENTNYYYRVFNECKINPYDVKDFSVLEKIPILTKKEIIGNYEDIKSRIINKINYLPHSTGGSSGDPLTFLLDKKSWSFSNAHRIISWQKGGYLYGDKYIALGSTSLFLNKKKSIKHVIYYKLKNKIGLNGVNMSEEVCSNYIKFIKKNKIKFLYGYASSIYLLAKYIIENKIQIEIIACFPTSEILTDNYKETIKEAFSCQIIDSYGAHDGGITAFSMNDFFYEISYNSIVITHQNKNNIGKLLVTDTFNFAMPLINYELGDEVEINNDFNTNFNGQFFNKIYGRTSDVIRLKNGNILTGPGFTILFKDLPVESYSIEQINDDVIVCKIKKMHDFENKHETLIIDTISRFAGEGISIKINYVEEGEILKNGKKKYFIVK